jgi:hypothetical protein
MALNSFADVQAFISQVLTTNGEDASGAPHKDFWNTLTYEQFTNKDNQPNQGNVPGVDSVQILVVGDSKNSNIIQALRGQGLFDPNTGQYPQMPAFGPTYFTEDQIDEIAAWIDNGCPE